MEVNSQLHTRFAPKKGAAVPIQQNDVRDPGLDLRFRQEKNLCPTEDSKPGSSRS